MIKKNSLSVKQWKDIFRYFPQIKKIDIDKNNKQINVSTQDGKILKISISEVKNHEGYPHEFVVDFLEKHKILCPYHKTLVGFFDIQAYSQFIKNVDINKAIEIIRNLLNSINNFDGYFFSSKLDIWVLSDSIIITINTNRHPLFSGSLEYFFGTCSVFMRRFMEKGFPLRGAIGGGNFYKEGNILVSSGLVDAVEYEKQQKWLGAVLTPKALELIKQAKILELKFKGKTQIDFSSNRFNEFIGYGNIPWKPSKKGREQKLKKPLKTYYIKPFQMADEHWVLNFLPDYFNDKEIIENSNCLYANRTIE